MNCLRQVGGSLKFGRRALEQSWPRHPVQVDRGADDLAGESITFGEERVHVIGLVFEQKETKETKNS